MFPHAQHSARAASGASQRRVPLLVVGLCFTAVCVSLAATRPQPLRELEALCYDALVRQLPAANGESAVAVVEIDEVSLQQFGQWPWPRYHLARLLDSLHEQGIQSAGIDILLAEPDRHSLRELAARYKQDLGIELPLQDSPVPDGDALLAQSLSQLPVALGMWLDPVERGTAVGCTEPAHTLLLRRSPHAPQLAPVPGAASAVCPLRALGDAAAGVGFLNALPDDDGRIRRAPLFVHTQGQVYPALALATVLLATGESQALGQLGRAGLENVQVAGLSLATDAHGNLLIPYQPGALERIPKISAARLLAGGIIPELKDKVVLVGITASGLDDRHPTPLSRSTPGLYIHALLADTLLRGSAFASPGWEPALQVCLTAACGIVLSLLMSFASLSLSSFAAIAVACLLLFGSQYLLQAHGIALSPVAPALSLVVGALLLGTLRHRIAERYTLLRMRELAASQECALRGFASVAETRDPETGAHIIRTQHFVRILAEGLRHHPQYRRELTPENLQLLVKSAPLHDIGKVSVPDCVLLKPGKLTDEEYEIMKQHAAAGYEVLQRARTGCEFADQLTFLNYAEEMALTHHEKWDGSGYPHGLKALEIPLAGRLMALADVYDALRAKRVYKPAIPHEKAREIILEGRGKHFDPEIVDTFLASEEAFQAICDKNPDEQVQAVSPQPQPKLAAPLPTG